MKASTAGEAAEQVRRWVLDGVGVGDVVTGVGVAVVVRVVVSVGTDGGGDVDSIHAGVSIGDGDGGSIEGKRRFYRLGGGKYRSRC